MLGRDQLEERAGRIADPVERLRYLRRHAPASRPRALEISIIEHSLPLAPPSTLPSAARPRRRRWVMAAGGALALAIALGLWQAGSRRMEAAQAAPSLPSAANAIPQPAVPLPPDPGEAPDKIWQVEATETSEVYSNGLRIDTSFAVHNRPRAEYGIYAPAGAADPATTSSRPRGIVYHTTESHLVPFEEASNRRLKRLGRNLLEIVREERSYHYLIDRFGRAFRVVEESDAANHAGKSVWADAEGIYVNLNDSFIGVAFEGQTGAAKLITAAQITTARQLTEMLRDRYEIAAENCIAHAQVSVNPMNMRIANHSDWVRDLPFAALGLTDNYRIPPASLTAFGFDYDDVFLQVAGKPWPGLAIAEQQVVARAQAEGATEIRYRAMLQHRYKQIAAALRQAEIERAQGE